MNREELLARVLNKRVRDYTFPVVFFLIFSVFVFFAIRPNLVTAFSLQRQLDELRLQDEKYDTVILNIVSYQSLIEQTREDFVVLDQAVPKSPLIYTLVADIRDAATTSGMVVNTMEVSDVSLQGKTLKDDQTKEKNKQYVVKFSALSSFNDVRGFFTKLSTQRRLKVVNGMNVTSATIEGTKSATFNISFILEGYYL